MRRLSLSLLSLLAILLLLAALAPVTATGSRLLVAAANRLAILEVEYAGGTLLGDLQLASIVLELEGLNVELKAVDSRLQGNCLWRSALCFESLDVQSMALVVAPGSGEEATDGIALPQIALPFELQVQSLQIALLNYDIAGSKGQLNALGLSGQWRDTELVLHRLAARQVGTGSAQLAGELSFSADWPLKASLDWQLDPALLPAWPQVHQGQLEAAGDLASLALELGLPGEVPVTGSGQVAVLAPGLPFRAEIVIAPAHATALGSVLPLPADSPLATWQVDEALLLAFDGNLQQQQLSASGRFSAAGYEGLAFVLAASHQQQVIELQSLQLRDDSGRNQLQAEGVVELAATPSWALQLSSAGMDLPALSAAISGRLAGTVDISGSLPEQGLQLALQAISLEGEVNDLPALVSGFASLQPGMRLGPSDLVAEVNGADLRLLAGAPGEGATLDLQVAEINRWLEGGRGQLALLAQLPEGSEALSFNGQLGEMSWQDLSIEGGELHGTMRVGAQPQLDADLAVRGLQQAGMELSQLRLALRGNQSQQHLRLDVSGALNGSLVFNGKTVGGGINGEIAPTVINSSDGSWQLAAPLALRWQAEEAQLAVAAHCWRHARFTFCPGDSVLGSAGNGAASITGDLAALDDFLPEDLDLAGSVDARLQARWQPGTPPQISGEARSRSIRVTRHYGLGDSVSVNWDRADGQFQREGEATRLELDVERGQRQVLALDLLLADDPDVELAGTLAFNGLRLDALAPWTPSLSTLAGNIEGRLRIGGQRQQPQLFGTLVLSDGQLALLSSPTALTDVKLAVELSGSSARLDGQALLGGGELTLAGTAELLPHWQLALDVEGSRHEVLMPPATSLLMSQSLKLRASAGQVSISGDITVHEGLLRHEELPAGSVAISADVVKVDYAGNVLEEEAPFDTQLDINLHMRNRVDIVGSNIRATVGGDLRLRQDPGRPLQVFGNLNVLGGELTAFRQRLDIRRGTVAFAGNPENPELDVRAERDIRDENITVGARLLGTVQAPQLEVYSDPVMSQSEAMSYLVRGRGLDSGAGADGTALALSLGANLANQSGVLSGVNSLPGINNVSFGASGSEDDTAATVSGYIGERIYLSYGIGIYEPINVMTARLYFNTRLWLEVVSRLENSLDLYYSFDID